MSVQRNVRFEHPPNGIPSPSYQPNFVLDLASSDDGLSEKFSESDQPAWSQRPKSMPWTSRPQALREKLRVRWWRDIMADVVTILMPLPFFILSAIVIALNGRQVDDWTLSALNQSIKASATIFPIFFAAITGRAAVKFATWKLEQGSTLGLLEQLMGSRTVISAIMTQVHLRSFNLIGLGLVVLWSLSPIGSQSVLHILESPAVLSPSTEAVTYFNSRQQSYSAPGGPFFNSWYSGFKMLFGAALLAPSEVKTNTMDLWGNVKIPYYSSVLQANTTVDGDGWTELPQTYTPIYSSLFGIPTFGLQLGNTSFTMESSYIGLNCSNLTTTNESNGIGQLKKNTLISPNGPFVSQNDVSLVAPWALGYQGPDVAAYNSTVFSNTSDTYTLPQSCPDCIPPNMNTTGVDPGILLYQEFDSSDNTSSVFCIPSQEYIESAITCEKLANSQTCKVTAQRQSQLPHADSSLTTLSFRTVILGLSSLLPNSTPQVTLTNSIQSYIYNPLSEASIISGTDSLGLGAIGLESPLLTMSMQDFSNNFGQIINTFLYASMWNATPYITGAPLNTITPTILGNNAASFVPASQADLVAMIQNRTSAFTVPATLTNQIQVYRVSFPWVIIFLLTTFAMLGSAIIGTVFSRNTVLPDYLGYVSSLAKESPYVRMPNGGANLDGMDRARLMKDLRVRLGNVDEGRGEVGRLAFARLEETGVVRKDSFYI